MTLLRTLALLVRAGTLGGFVAGGALAAWQIGGRTMVLEFQAGAPSSIGEKLLATVQRAAVEGIGWGLIAGVLGLVALVLAPLGGRRSAAPPEQRFQAALLLVAAALAVWLLFGASLAGAAVPLLDTPHWLTLQLAGFLALALGFGLFDAIARRLPGSREADPLAGALASLIGIGAAALAARAILRSGTAPLSDPLRLGLALLCPLVALFAVARGAPLLHPPVAALRRALDGRTLLPRRGWWIVGGLFFLVVVVGRPFLGLYPSPAEASYPRLADRGSPAGPNVVLIVVDTLRADHLSCYGYPRPTSPNLDALAAAGARFEHPIAPASWTKPSTGTILTGLYPSRHGALYHGSSLHLPEGASTLAESFSRAGYVTAGFVSNPNIKRVFDFDLGFDEYFDSPAEDTLARASLRDSLFGAVLTRFTGLQFNWKYENDVRQMNRHVFAWLEENATERFFLYLHYIDPHEPYAPPAEYVERFRGDHEGFPLFEERKRLVGIDRYDGEIAYSDAGLGELFEELERRGIRDETLLVVTSDHGEEFGEHEVLGHGFSVYEPVIRVPLIAQGPGVPAGVVVRETVQLVDLPATLLELAGLGVTELGDGRSFATALTPGGWEAPRYLHVENEFGRDEDHRRSYVFSSVREGRWKLVLTERSAARPPSDPRYGPLELYDLDADPGEQHNRIADPELAELRERLLGQLREHARWLDENGLRDAAPADLNEETEAALKALGYL